MLIHERAGGIPRTISVIADNALVTGFALESAPGQQRRSSRRFAAISTLLASVERSSMSRRAVTARQLLGSGARARATFDAPGSALSNRSESRDSSRSRTMTVEAARRGRRMACSTRFLF